MHKIMSSEVRHSTSSNTYHQISIACAFHLTSICINEMMTFYILFCTYANSNNVQIRPVTWIVALSWLSISSDESWRTFLFICLHKVEFDYISPESCYPPDKFDWNATKLKGKVLKYAGHWPIRMQKKQDLLWFFTFQPFQDEIEVYRKRRP